MKKYSLLAVLITSLITAHAMNNEKNNNPLSQIKEAQDYEKALVIYYKPEYASLFKEPMIKNTLIEVLSKKFNIDSKNVALDLQANSEITKIQKANL